MYNKLIKNDIRKTKLITVTITAFILISAMLVSLAANLTVNLFGAIDNMLAAAKTAHFTRMHAGNVDISQVKQFAESNANVESWQVLEYLNIEGAQIAVGGDNLAWSTQDNGFSTQSESFDFLLDLEGNIIQPVDGEVWFPLYYMKTGSAKVGDTVTVHGVELTVAGFLRDSMMNPAMANSKRFLVSENDFEKLRNLGIMEYLIEFRLFDPSASATFESGYIAAGMPANGPQAITYPLVRMINGIENGMMIAVLALISILVIIVAFLCIRFTLLAKIEEDYREIGVLKAVGLRVSDIKKLYMAKYGALAAIAAMLGFLLSFAVQTPLMENIRLYLGVSGQEAFGALAGLAGAAAIFLIVMLYVSGVLRRFRKISAAQAVRFGAPQEKSKSAKGLSLAGGVLSPNVFLALKDVLSRKKLYITMFLVVVISSFIMVVPQNISSTISSLNFFTNMGIGMSDFSLYASNAQTQDVRGLSAEIANRISQDESVAQYAWMTTRLFEMPPADGAVERMQVTLGDHEVFPITYTHGAEPKTTDEIAISTLYADDFGKSVGDEIVLMVDGAEKRLTVCGIYTDITNAGKTAKAVFEATEGDILNSSVWVALHAPAETAAKVAQYSAEFPAARVTGVHEMAAQVFGDVASTIGQAGGASIAIAALLTALVTLLFLKMLVTKDRYPIAILKSMGFTARSIGRQYMLRAAIVFVLGVLVGTVLANTLGEYVGVALMSSFGASTFHFEINPLFAYVFSPLLLALCVYVATLLGSADIRRVKISEHIKEA
ncbi:MAG TPA: ABC transporter permease [Clostridiales bacterium]|nr:ABC transporter permease [Clostridiales bacterium]